MKKIALFLSLGVLSLTFLSADYQLTLIDKDGLETKQCIKSYSFSNNLESIARQNGLKKDIYSEEETLTEKVYLGKPVYRKVILLDDFIVFHGQRVDRYSNVISESIDKIMKFNYTYNNNGVFYDNYNDYVRYEKGEHTYTGAWYNYDEKKAMVRMVQKHPNFTEPYNISDFKFIIEYTKTTDNVNNSKNTFKSYLHYIPSSSENEELINVDLKDVGVQFLENYTYDSLTGSCIKN